MEKKIRILHLEDEESDATLVRHVIHTNLKNVELKWVENQVDFVKTLNDFDPELVISDFRLPSFDGLAALKIQQQIKPGIPLIMFTGSVDEDTAVACIKAGAADYIIKEHLKRLVPAIINALESKEIALAKLKAEQNLIKSEARFHRLADNMPDMIYRITLEPERAFEYVNPAAEKITGYSVDEFYNNSKLGEKIIHPDDMKILDERIQSGEYFYKPIILRLIRKDGTTILFEQRNIPIYDENGKLTSIEGIAQDITEKVNAELSKQAIFSIAQAANSSKNLNELFQEVHKSISDIMPANNFYIALYDKATNQISFPYFQDEFDSTPEPRKPRRGFTEYVLNTGESLLCDPDCTKVLLSMGKIEQIGQTHSIWLGVPLKFENNTIGVMAVQHYSDIKAYGEREKSMLEYVSTQVAKAIVYKQAEEQILKLSKAVNQSPVSIIITNTIGEIEYTNPYFTEITGYSIDEVLGKNPNILQSGKTSKEVYSELWETILSGNVWQGEFINKKKNGELFIESAKISPVLDDEGKTIFFLSVKEDISEKKRIEQELINAKVKAEESDKLKTAFIQNISHEIRTPMNAIVGFSDLMQLNYNNVDKLKYYIRIIKQRSEDLLGIINQLLDISRIETGQLKLKIEKVDLNNLFEEIYTQFTQQAHYKSTKSVKLIPSKVPSIYETTINTDQGKLKQILNNLINNAYKFTTNGEIKFGFHSIINDTLTLSVSDTGVGIADEMKELIFERFRKSSDESIYIQDGLGLGLAIVKGLLQLFGGTIWVESELNKGSTFYFSIPYNPVQESKKYYDVVEHPVNNWSNYTVLLVEDDTYNVAYFIELLKETEIKYLLATTGHSAIHVFETNKSVDLVLMDIKLPDLNGYQVTREFKRIRPEIPVIAQTAYTSELDRQKALDAGCIDFISKPIKQELLFELLNKYLIPTNERK